MGFGVGVLDWFLFGLGFQLMGFGACGVELSGSFWGWGSIYKHRRITLGKKLAFYICVVYRIGSTFASQWNGVVLLISRGK